MGTVEIRRALDSADVAEQAAEFILERMQSRNGRFDIALTGGTVGILTLKHLARKLERSQIDFRNIHFWFGDERFVEHDSSDRNAVQARGSLLNQLPISEEQIHEMPAANQFADLDEAVLSFRRHLESEFQGLEPKMDLAILGMGPDGHVASLFPGHSYPNELIVAESDSPKPPAQRISMSYQMLNASKEVLFVVSGVDKAEAVEKVHKDEKCELPAAKIEATGQTTWIVDMAAGAAFWSC